MKTTNEIEKRPRTVHEKPAKVRLSLEVNQELNQLLDELATQMGATKSDVLRRGIALMEVSMAARARGERLVLVDDEDEVTARILGL